MFKLLDYRQSVQNHSNFNIKLNEEENTIMSTFSKFVKYGHSFL